MMGKPATCVVVCYWVGQPLKSLHRLLDQMLKVDAGAPFSVTVVANGGDEKPLTLPEKYGPLSVKVVNRVNHGFNIEAWDVGWRADADHDYFLFLQSECFLKRPGWVADYQFRMSRDRGVGLLGELYNWEQKTWEFIREATDRDLGERAWPKDEPLHPIDAIKATMQEHGIPLTELGTHIPTIICFTSRRVLEDIGGIPLFGSTYRQAVASEVAFSRVIESKGYRLSRVRDRDFSLIGHHQYTRRYEAEMKLRGLARGVLRKIGLKR